jgi:recombinational DNA repair protein (RecF pathway)
MRDEGTNDSAPSQPPAAKRCSGCGQEKFARDFYLYRGAKLSSRCKDCQCEAARTTSRDRRSALRLLIAAHSEEWTFPREVDTGVMRPWLMVAG